jgi:hypothetical protein
MQSFPLTVKATQQIPRADHVISSCILFIYSLICVSIYSFVNSLTRSPTYYYYYYFRYHFYGGIYNYISETNHFCRVYSVAAALCLQFMLHIMLFPFLNVMYFYISAFRSICVVPHMIVSCSLISSFPGIIIIIIISSSSSSSSSSGNSICLVNG